MKRFKIFLVYVGAVLLWAALSAYSVHAGSVTTSGITVDTIATRAQVYLDASGDPFFTSAKYIQWTNEAIIETVNKTNCLESTAITVTLVADTYQYSMTGGATFQNIVSVEHNNGDTTDSQQIITLDRVHKNDIGHNDSTGRPRTYTVWANKIEVWPIPRTDEADTVLYVYRVPIPTGVSALSSSIETPAYLDTAILYYVVAMGFNADNQMEKGGAYLKLYDQRIAEYKAMVLQRKPIE